MNIKFYWSITYCFLIAGCASQHEQLYDTKPAFYSYIIGDVDRPHITTEHAADVFVTPASCQKTITSLLAYKSLGKDYRFATKAYITRQNGVIQDVIIEGSGDPTLTAEALKDLLEPLRGKSIQGKIVIDASLFHTPDYSRNIMVDDLGRPFAPPISSLNLDQNLIEVTVHPTELGKKALIHNDAGYRVNAYVATNFDPSSVKFGWEGDHIKATGTQKSGDKPLVLKIAPLEMKAYILNKMKPILRGLKIKNPVVFVKDPYKSNLNKVLMTSVVSEPLEKMIPVALKKSDNLVFDALYLKLIHARDPALIKDWHDGDKILKGLIHEHFHVQMEKALLIDGSGLSRYNQITPRQLFKILKCGYESREFVDALASPGEANSTLEKRNTLPQTIKAKTGNMSGISCLCGYRLKDKDTKVFVIIANSFSPPSAEMYAVLDTFVAENLGD